MAQQDWDVSGFVQAISSMITAQNNCAQHEQCDSSCPGRLGLRRYHESSTGVRSNEVDMRAELARQNNHSSSTPTRTEPLTINPDTPLFRYTRLERPDGRIRLLKTKPAVFRADPVDVELFETDLDKAPAYGALSYCWGTGPVNEKILCNGQVFYATESLVHSLKRLRAGFRPGDREDWIWADAICINQQDAEEKNAQVWMMNKIYSTASTVYADLGGLAGHRIPVGKGLAVEFSGATSGLGAQDVLSESDHPSHPLHFKTAFTALTRPYFTRTWVIQELVLARKVKYIFYGNVFMQDELDAILSKQALHAHPERMQELISGGSALSQGFLNYQKIQSIKKAYLAGHKNSLYFIEQTRDFDASEPKDKIYGLLALLNDDDRKGIGPYYQTVEQAYRRFAALQVYLGYTIAMLDMAGLQKQHQPHKRELPSWVPDWTAQYRSAKVISTIRPVPYKATKSIPPRIELLGTAGSNGLKLKGLLIDRLVSVTPFADPEPDTTFLDYHNRMRANFDSWLNRPRSSRASFSSWLRSSRRSAYPDNEDAFARLLLMDDTYTGGNAIAMSSPINTPAQTYRETLERWRTGVAKAGGRKMNAAETFQMQAETTCSKRSFAITEKGRIALVPHLAANDDVVVLIYGASVPYLVRRTGHGFLLLGDAYVHGVMNGEAATTGKFSSTDIVLI